MAFALAQKAKQTAGQQMQRQVERQERLVAELDFDRLLELLKQASSRTTASLAEALAMAQLRTLEEMPSDVVRMNSVIKMVDEATDHESEVMLVYPDNAAPSEGRISVLAPLGQALLGLRVSEGVLWPTPKGGSRRMRITSVDHVEHR